MDGCMGYVRSICSSIGVSKGAARSTGGGKGIRAQSFDTSHLNKNKIVCNKAQLKRKQLHTIFLVVFIGILHESFTKIKERIGFVILLYKGNTSNNYHFNLIVANIT